MPRPGSESKAASREGQAVPDPGASLKLVSRREHNIRSMVELSRTLSHNLDLEGVADLSLFNLMGRLGISKSALWVLSPEAEDGVTVICSHGMRPDTLSRVGGAVAPRLMRATPESGGPVDAAELFPEMPAGDAARMVTEAGFVLFGPIESRANLVGFVGLGARKSGLPLDDLESESINGSLAVLGMAIENTRLLGDLLASHRELERSHESLAVLDRLKSGFLRKANHRMRAPLADIVSHAEELESTLDAEDIRRKRLRAIHDQGAALSALVERVVDFSAIVEDGLEFNLGPGDVLDTVAAFYRTRRSGIELGGHGFGLEHGAGVPRCRFDPQWVTHILEVVVEHAVQTTPPGTRITLSVDPDPGGNGVRIEVSDDGPGIDGERVDVLCDFFRHCETGSSGEAGAEMGLAFARELAEAMGGALILGIKRVPPGSYARLRLPAAEAGRTGASG